MPMESKRIQPRAFYRNDEMATEEEIRTYFLGVRDGFKTYAQLSVLPQHIIGIGLREIQERELLSYKAQKILTSKDARALSQEDARKIRAHQALRGY